VTEPLDALEAVELGIGASLLPTFICAESLADRRVVEPFAVSELIEREPWFASTRTDEIRRPAVSALLRILGAPPAGSEAAARSMRR